ncbi:multidrug efflux RND transporter permease subunit [Aurantiacibacter flavus]|uniref:Efflux pump membrane transporter n=1 Tax=Aurantiacibacter flavus TaxID=3145232 RepID=A0ABV0CTG0_9SPHN
MADFFIRRPIFSWVLAIGILLSGILALRSLAIEQYPDIAPPSLTVSAVYTGADAATVEQNVTQILEQEINGIEGLQYMSATSSSNGSSSINVTFAPGTDIDIAQTQVQNRLSSVESRLPAQVRQIGVSVRQASNSFMLVVALSSKSGETGSLELGNLASSYIVDELRRVPGVGDITQFGSSYAMRIWLDPQKLASYGLAPSDVTAAIQEQNAQVGAGAIGDQPLTDGQQITASIVTDDRLSTVEEFEQIILRTESGGNTVRLADVARVELGAQTYASDFALSGAPAAGLAVQLATGANALDTAAAVKQRVKELEETLPDDVEATIPYDTTPFIELSVEEVIVTLVEAMVLVFLVMFLFLQNWRATIIPALVVPIALAGACLGLWFFGFTINVLTLFGMVLAIGILVDDAIVVIENVERIMSEEGLPPLQATQKAMKEITGAIIGITLVLIAVFVPMAFFGGSVGGIYRQFSVTLASSIFFSAVLALTLTPALCATFLKPVHDKDGAEAEAPTTRWGKLKARVDGLFGGFNRWFTRMTGRYGRTNDKILSRPFRALMAFVLICAVTAFLYLRLPTAFLPQEDQGDVVTVVQTPPGATAARTQEVLNELQAYWDEQPEIATVITAKGFSFFGNGQNNAMMFVRLKDWSERTAPENSASALAGRAMQHFAGISDATVFVIQRPAIQALGNASGFTMKIEDRAGLGRDQLEAARNQLLGAAMQSDVVTGVRPEEQADNPQLEVSVDRVQARAQGLSINAVNSALAVNFGSYYVNDFPRDGRIQRVIVQADADYRMTPEDILSLRVPNANGGLVPFSSFAQVKWSAGPPSLARYNGYPAMTISGQAAPGYSSGAALAEMEKLAKALPASMSYEWTGLSFEEKESAGQVGILLGLSLLVVFLLLAALYESWAVPFAVLLIIPAGVLGSVIFSMLRGFSADVYFNVGLITIIGLAAKNAILIVEFAIEREAQGKSILEAVEEAARLRLRPILMTSLAFVAGMVPLVIASGAGAASRAAVGSGVMGGMIAATAIGIFLIPVLYLLVRKHLSRHKPAVAGAPTLTEDTPA